MGQQKKQLWQTAKKTVIAMEMAEVTATITTPTPTTFHG
jgi:hypothetical protein